MFGCEVVEGVSGGGVDVSDVVGLLGVDGSVTSPTLDRSSDASFPFDLLSDDAGVLSILGIGVLRGHC